jgi:alcohol dehydrogenase class IV
VALGCPPGASPLATAETGLERLAAMSRNCGIPQRLRDLGIAEADLPELAQSALKVTRLLKNNPREMSLEAAEKIYRAAF